MIPAWPVPPTALIAGYAAYRADWSPGEAEIHTLLAGLLLNEGRATEAVDAARLR